MWADVPAWYPLDSAVNLGQTRSEALRASEIAGPAVGVEQPGVEHVQRRLYATRDPIGWVTPHVAGGPGPRAAGGVPGVETLGAGRKRVRPTVGVGEVK